MSPSSRHILESFLLSAAASVVLPPFFKLLYLVYFSSRWVRKKKTEQKSGTMKIRLSSSRALHLSLHLFSSLVHQSVFPFSASLCVFLSAFVSVGLSVRPPSDDVSLSKRWGGWSPDSVVRIDLSVRLSVRPSTHHRCDGIEPGNIQCFSFHPLLVCLTHSTHRLQWKQIYNWML